MTPWTERKVNDLIDGLVAGVSVRSYDGDSSRPAVLKTSAVANGRVDFRETKTIVVADVSRAKCEPVRDSIVISRMNTPALVGAVGYVDSDEPGVFLPDRLWLARSRRSASTDMRWLNYALGFGKVATSVRELATGTSNSMKNIPKSRLLELPLLVPSPDEQREIATVLADIDVLITSLERLIDKKRAIKQGMMQELLTGRTRLPGFTGEWQTMPFDAVAKPINTRGSQVEAREYELSGALTIVDQGQAKTAGYTNRAMRPIEPGLDGLLVFGDHTCVTKYIDFPFVVGADGTKVLKSTDKKTCSIRFIAYLLEHDPIEQSGYNRHFSKLRERNFTLPVREEQQAVVSILTDIDEEIDRLGRRLESTRAIKQGMMQELLTGRTRLPVAEEVSA